MHKLIRLFTSLKFTAVLLALALVLVFIGTIAQVEHGLYQAQARYFRSLFVFWAPGGGSLRLPVFPGGYLLGCLMLINLTAVGLSRFKPGRANWGLLLIHSGLVLLLLGQLFTDMFSVESAMRISAGETKNYSEDFHANELVVINASDPDSDRFVSIPERLVRTTGEISVPSTPFVLGIERYWINADLLTQETAAAEPSQADQGIGVGIWVAGKPPTSQMGERNLPAAVIEVRAGATRLGSWLVSGLISQPQVFEHDGQTWQLALRPKRHYTPFSLTLVECRHDVYKGTDIPKNFSSRVIVRNPETGEDREVLIWMNNPLRYGGNTYYQYQMAAASESSTLQVVRNPTAATPYISCSLVGLGLIWQFLAHLIGFLRRRRHEK